jgi:hypothetical protein
MKKFIITRKSGDELTVNAQDITGVSNFAITLGDATAPVAVFNLSEIVSVVEEKALQPRTGEEKDPRGA